MKRLRLLIVASIVLLLLGSVFPVAAKKKPSFVGEWYGTDPFDGSYITLTIKEESRSAGKVFSISSTDDATGPWCTSRGAAELKAVGLRTEENVITSWAIWWCLPPGTGTIPSVSSPTPLELTFSYDPSTDTIVDNSSFPVTYYRLHDE